MEIQITNSNTHVCAYVTARMRMQGSVSASCLDGKNWYLNRAFVVPELRKSGLGKKLVEARYRRYLKSVSA